MSDAHGSTGPWVSRVLDRFSGISTQGETVDGAVVGDVGAEAVEFVFEELRREVGEGHRRLDALRERVTRMFALSGVLLGVIAAFAAALGTWWATLLFVPALLVVVAFGVVWREEGRPRTPGSVAHALLSDPEAGASSAEALRRRMIPLLAEALERNEELRRRRRRVLTRAENLIALAMIIVVTFVLLAAPQLD